MSKHPMVIRRPTEARQDRADERSERLQWSDRAAGNCFGIFVAGLDANSQAYMDVVHGFRKFVKDQSGTLVATSDLARAYFNRR